MAAFIPHVLHVLSPAHAGLDDEWDGYDMYDMDAGSGEEGRRRAAIAAEQRPRSPTDWAASIDEIIADRAVLVSSPRPVWSRPHVFIFVGARVISPAAIRQ